jgi:hypothetical protein
MTRPVISARRAPKPMISFSAYPSDSVPIIRQDGRKASPTSSAL